MQVSNGNGRRIVWHSLRELFPHPILFGCNLSHLFFGGRFDWLWWWRLQEPEQKHHCCEHKYNLGYEAYSRHADLPSRGFPPEIMFCRSPNGRRSFWLSCICEQAHLCPSPADCKSSCHLSGNQCMSENECQPLMPKSLGDRDRIKGIDVRERWDRIEACGLWQERRRCLAEQ